MLTKKKPTGKSNILEVFSGIIFSCCMLKFSLGLHWYSGSVGQTSKHQVEHHPWIVFGTIIGAVMSIFVVVTRTLLISFKAKCTISSKQMIFIQNV